MSPEQADRAGAGVDTTADVYSLGVILYELLVGMAPLNLRRLPADEILRKLRTEDVPRPSAKLRELRDGITVVAQNRSTEPRSLIGQIRGDPDSIVLKAVEKERARRYGDPWELATDIEHYLHDEPVSARPAGTGYATWKYVRRHRVGARFAAVLVFVLVTAVIVSLRIALRATRAGEDANAVSAFLQVDVLRQASVDSQNEWGVRPDPNLTRAALDEAAARIQGKFGDRPLLEALIRRTIGSTYYELGLYAQAELELRRVAEIHERVLGEQNRETLQSKHSLASLYYQEGQVQEAEKLTVETLDGQRRVLGREHEDTLTTTQDLANIYYREGRYAEAFALYSELLRVPTKKKIAVLPFHNVGNTGENQALCDGLTEVLTRELTELEQFHKLSVIPSTDVRREQLTRAEGARRALGANLVITGSVQRDAAQVYLTVSVIDAGTSRQLSSRSFRKGVANFAELQESVVREIARMLDLDLSSNERQILASGETKAAGAYDFYLQAQGYLQRRSVADLDHAIDLLDRAVAQDRNYVLAYAGLGEAYWKKYRLTNDTRWVEPAQRNCDRALALSDRLATVHVMLGVVQESTGRHQEAVRSFLRALELDPINAGAYRELGNAYEAMGRVDEAEATFKKASALRPDDFTSMNDLGLFYYRRGRFQDAEPVIRRITQLFPDNSSGYSNLAAVHWMDGQYTKAAPSYERSLALRPTASAYSSLGTVYFFMDRCAEAVPLMEKATELLPRNDAVWSNLGDVYVCSPNGQHKAAEAYRHAEQLGQERLSINTNDAETLGHVALNEAHLGNTKDAIAKAKRAVKLAPSSRSVAWHATLAYELAGQRDLALEALRAALRAGEPAWEVEIEPALKNLRAEPAGQCSRRAVEGPRALLLPVSGCGQRRPDRGFLAESSTRRPDARS
jgi:tetratricopeptide (TPR) repeat protein